MEAGGGVVLERTWQFQQMGNDISVGKKKKRCGGEQEKLLKTWVGRQQEWAKWTIKKRKASV